MLFRSANDLRILGDQLKDKIKTGIGVLFARIEGKVSILVIVTPDLSKQYHAGKIVGRLASIVDGKGGGRPDSAMAGGRDISKIAEALNSVREIVSNFKNGSK